MKIVKSVCNMCLCRCGIDVYVENGKIVKVIGMQEHPFNTLCIKPYAIPELVHSSERLTNPLKKVNGEFSEISWDEALGFIADKLTAIKRKYGAKAVLVHLGQPFVQSHIEYMARRFWDLYGTPNYTSGSSFCYMARTIGHSLTCGTHVIPQYSAATRCMLIWGVNPADSRPLETDEIHAMAGRGAKLIVVDPRATPLAKKADIHVQLRPGTDGALALGLLNVIIAEELYDKAFVEQWTVGFDKLVEHIKDYSPEKIEEITWVPAEVIRNVARMYATNKPAPISLGIAVDHHTNGIQAVRAITTLIAITGNLDIPGGDIYMPKLRLTNLRLEEKVTEDLPVGIDYPLYTKYVREQTVVPAIKQLVAEKPYPIKALVIAGGNPAVTWPDANKLKQGREKLDLMVVIDIFMTDTAKMADIVLPGTTFLERQDLRNYALSGRSLITLANRVVEPIGNSMEDWKIWVELGKKMGYAEYFPWKDSDELLEHLLKPTSISLNQLRQNPGGIYYAAQEFQKYLKDGFNTPSGKVEIYSQTMKDYGHDPLPTFHEPAESPVSQPDLAEKYPLILISGARTIAFTHSRYRNLPSLRRLVPEPLMEINSQTADSLGIADGDSVKVESTRGSIKIKAKLTEDIHPKVVSIQHGWSQANVNYLTDDEARDPVSAYPGFKSVMCRVTATKDDAV